MQPSALIYHNRRPVLLVENDFVEPSVTSRVTKTAGWTDTYHHFSVAKKNVKK